MNKTNFDLVREFHDKFGLPILLSPQFPDKARRQLRMSLILEELEEFSTALETKDILGVIDALGDLAYVVYGAALEFGIDLNRAIAIIHESNMSKLGIDGQPIRREDGKILKGPGFFPPNFSEMLK